MANHKKNSRQHEIDGTRDISPQAEVPETLRKLLEPSEWLSGPPWTDEDEKDFINKVGVYLWNVYGHTTNLDGDWISLLATQMRIAIEANLHLKEHGTMYEVPKLNSGCKVIGVDYKRNPATLVLKDALAMIRMIQNDNGLTAKSRLSVGAKLEIPNNTLEASLLLDNVTDILDDE